MRASWIIHLVLCASLCCLASGPGDDGDGLRRGNRVKAMASFMHGWCIRNTSLRRI